MLRLYSGCADVWPGQLCSKRSWEHRTTPLCKLLSQVELHRLSGLIVQMDTAVQNRWWWFQWLVVVVVVVVVCTHGNAGAIGGVGVTLQLFSTQPPRAARIFLEQSLIFIVIISFLSDYKKQEKNLNAYHSNQLSSWSSDAALSSDMSDMMYHHCCQMSSQSSVPFTVIRCHQCPQMVKCESVWLWVWVCGQTGSHHGIMIYQYQCHHHHH